MQILNSQVVSQSGPLRARFPQKAWMTFEGDGARSSRRRNKAEGTSAEGHPGLHDVWKYGFSRESRDSNKGFRGLFQFLEVAIRQKFRHNALLRQELPHLSNGRCEIAFSPRAKASV